MIYNFVFVSLVQKVFLVSKFINFFVMAYLVAFHKNVEISLPWLAFSRNCLESEFPLPFFLLYNYSLVSLKGSPPSINFRRIFLSPVAY